MHYSSVMSAHNCILRYVIISFVIYNTLIRNAIQFDWFDDMIRNRCEEIQRRKNSVHFKILLFLSPFANFNLVVRQLWFNRKVWKQAIQIDIESFSFYSVRWLCTQYAACFSCDVVRHNIYIFFIMEMTDGAFHHEKKNPSEISLWLKTIEMNSTAFLAFKLNRIV